MQAFVHLAPTASLAMVTLAVILAAASWNLDIGPMLFAWCYTTTIVCFQLLRLWTRWQKDPAALSVAPERTLRAIAAHAGVAGAVWGVLIALLILDKVAANMALMGALTIGMICAGAFLLSMLPSAALLYTAGVMIGYIAGQLYIGEAAIAWMPLVFLVLAAVVQFCVAWYHANFVRQVLTRFELEESGQVISLLLHDFETHASDWLWETDAEGRLDRVSLRFAQAVRRPRETLEGESFLSFFESEYAEQLRELLENERTFRDLIVPVWVQGEKFWWSISAQPKSSLNGIPSGYRGVCSDVTTERTAEAKIAHMAHFDALTGVSNRAKFAADLEQACEQLAHGGEGFALHCIDLDDFKNINDTMGHPAGDELLRTVARRLRQCIGEDDVIGRQGGDEFVILQRHVSEREDAVLLADFIVDSMLEPVMLESRRVLVTGSVGSACAPEDGAAPKILLKNADLALYAAKKAGRGCSLFFEPSMDAIARRRSRIEADLRQALHANELELHFQPLISVETRGVKGYESLLRWFRTDGEIVGPAEFIEVAENSGLIIPLGEWVIRTAIAEAATWPEHRTVAINLSPIQMTNPSLITTVMSALAASGLDPARVEFEITETVLLEETDANLKTLHALREIGAKIALDDFGTGFSSLNYLRAFPFDKIKIDKCFVAEMEEREDCRAIISAVLSLAKSLGMRTTAEGVETQNQLDMLVSQGCSEIQGFFFSEPIPAANVPKCGVSQLEAAAADMNPLRNVARFRAKTGT